MQYRGCLPGVACERPLAAGCRIGSDGRPGNGTMTACDRGLPGLGLVRVLAATALLACAHVRAGEPVSKVNTGHDDCTGASIVATYSPQLQFGLDGQNMSPSMFTAEVVRRREGQPLRCIIVVASCRDAALSKQTFKALKPYGVTRMSWQPDRKLFPDPTIKMPECKQ